MEPMPSTPAADHPEHAEERHAGRARHVAPEPRPDDPAEHTIEAAQDMAEWAGQAHATLESAVRQRPYAAVAAGIGVGYVLGGGVPNWALRVVLGTATRAAVAAYLGSLAASPEEGSP